MLTATVGFTDADGHTTELWSVGHVGMALRLRGGVWEQVPTGTSVDLHGLWGTAPDDLWAVGDEGTILHYDGAAWSRVESGDTVPLTALWGSGRRDVWAAGYHGHVLHWDGQTWSRSLNPFPNHLYGIWGVAGDTRVNETRTLYAVGAEGTQLKWNGERWSAVPPLHTQSSFAVFGTSPDNVWTAAAGGIATHYDGTAWRASPTRTPFDLLAIGGTGPSDMWIAGGSSRIAHFDGDRWWTDQVGLREVTYRATWACGQNRAWFVGDQGKVVEWTADKGYTIRTKAFSDGYVHGGDIVEVRSISGSGPDDMWAASSDGLLHWEGSAWSRVATLGSPYQVWASRKNDAYATTYVGNTGKWHLLHWDGSVWTDAFANPDGLDFEAATGWDMAIGGTGPNDVWFTVPTLWTAGYGAPSLLHFDGTSWSVAAELAGYRIWAPGPGEAWIVGADRFYRHRPDGTASFRMPVGTQFRDIWGPSSVPATDIGPWVITARWRAGTVAPGRCSPPSRTAPSLRSGGARRPTSGPPGWASSSITTARHGPLPIRSRRTGSAVRTPVVSGETAVVMSG